MNTLVYLLYGETEEYHLELTYSIASMLCRLVGEAPRVVLVTDQKTRRDDLPIEYLRFTPEEFSAWTFGGKFNHAAKIGALRKAAEAYPGKIALFDTDTYLLGSINDLFDRITPSSVVMHADEGPLAIGFPLYADLPVDPDSHMINSGVMGISDASYLDDALALTRKLLEASRVPVHTLEQYALGVTFAEQFDVRTSDDLVRHYHGYVRRFIHKRIKDLVPDFSRQSFQGAINNFVPVEGFASTRKTDVIRARLQAYRRRLEGYAFARQCHLNAERLSDFADAWAGTALDVVTHKAYPKQIVQQDFAGIDRLPLSDAVRQRWAAYLG